MANIRDLAKEAGVSVATVSRVLNGYPYVSEEKRKAVWEAVEKLNYTKNIQAVHLAKGRTTIVGVMLPYIHHPYFSAIIEGVSKEALRYGYQLLLFQTNYDVERELEALERLRMKQMDGLIVCSHQADWEIFAEYQEEGPIALCERVDGYDFFTVYIDHYQAFAKALRYLLDKGHRRIGYCIGRRTGPNSQARAAAYEEVLRDAGVTPQRQWIFDGCLFLEDGKRVIEQWMAMGERPSALLVTSDQVAAGIVLYAQRVGVRIPDELAIIGFDNDPLAEMLGITTVALPHFTLGERAFRLLHHWLETGNVPRKQEELPTRLIVRATG
ncbi:LacI family DNA-binding transcriptional regulator [Geobacillus subterraneus]|uniref:LacI family DNA-binding transcriptional regulator n=1 Tax=Geobacillus subterraneus TaxID=129338 RepID=UPI001442A53F|nr:LacI family DNA-binding transcriptional regulator [Geobacillus subterraneus]QIZ66716.1 LacI family DNA-binding transcriptional regulator [Geobacillus subterraneus]WPZ18941.1 LacI family DNA-binding transcriptional regulator [Geobacillus subterraneus]